MLMDHNSRIVAGLLPPYGRCRNTSRLIRCADAMLCMANAMNIRPNPSLWRTSMFWKILRVRFGTNLVPGAAALLIPGVIAFSAVADSDDTSYPAASLTPAVQSGWQDAEDELDVDAPPDE